MWPKTGQRRARSTPPRTRPQEIPASFVREEYGRRIGNIYEQHNPAYVDKLDTLLDKYAGKEHFLYSKVCRKYGEGAIPKEIIYRNLRKVMAKSNYTREQGEPSTPTKERADSIARKTRLEEFSKRTQTWSRERKGRPTGPANRQPTRRDDAKAHQRGWGRVRSNQVNDMRAQRAREQLSGPPSSPRDESKFSGQKDKKRRRSLGSMVDGPNNRRRRSSSMGPKARRRSTGSALILKGADHDVRETAAATLVARHKQEVAERKALLQARKEARLARIKDNKETEDVRRLSVMREAQRQHSNTKRSVQNMKGAKGRSTKRNADARLRDTSRQLSRRLQSYRQTISKKFRTPTTPTRNKATPSRNLTTAKRIISKRPSTPTKRPTTPIRSSTKRAGRAARGRSRTTTPSRTARGKSPARRRQAAAATSPADGVSEPYRKRSQAAARGRKATTSRSDAYKASARRASSRRTPQNWQFEVPSAPAEDAARDDTVQLDDMYMDLHKARDDTNHARSPAREEHQNAGLEQQDAVSAERALLDNENSVSNADEPHKEVNDEGAGQRTGQRRGSIGLTLQNLKSHTRANGRESISEKMQRCYQTPSPVMNQREPAVDDAYDVQRANQPRSPIQSPRDELTRVKSEQALLRQLLSRERTNWRIGTVIEVFSRTESKWCNGVIQERRGDDLVVRYQAGPQDYREKNLEVSDVHLRSGPMTNDRPRGRRRSDSYRSPHPLPIIDARRKLDTHLFDDHGTHRKDDADTRSMMSESSFVSVDDYIRGAMGTSNRKDRRVAIAVSRFANNISAPRAEGFSQFAKVQTAILATVQELRAILSPLTSGRDVVLVGNYAAQAAKQLPNSAIEPFLEALPQVTDFIHDYIRATGLNTNHVKPAGRIIPPTPEGAPNRPPTSPPETRVAHAMSHSSQGKSSTASDQRAPTSSRGTQSSTAQLELQGERLWEATMQNQADPSKRIFMSPVMSRDAPPQRQRLSTYSTDAASPVAAENEYKHPEDASEMITREGSVRRPTLVFEDDGIRRVFTYEGNKMDLHDEMHECIDSRTQTDFRFNRRPLADVFQFLKKEGTPANVDSFRKQALGEFVSALKGATSPLLGHVSDVQPNSTILGDTVSCDVVFDDADAMESETFSTDLLSGLGKLFSIAQSTFQLVSVSKPLLLSVVLVYIPQLKGSATLCVTFPDDDPSVSIRDVELLCNQTS